tara:strand:+ start:11383 stop:11901 length:519 start_codon:yes stop_codon:yes gene_type:complete
MISLFALPAMAFEISTQRSFGTSATLSDSSYTVQGTQVTKQLSHRHIDATDALGQRSQGTFRERTLKTTYLDQYGSGSGVSGSGSVGAGSIIGGLATGYEASIGGGVESSQSHDRSVTHERGRSVTDVNISLAGSHVGDSREVVKTNATVRLNNNSYTTGVNGWNKFVAYVQ